MKAAFLAMVVAAISMTSGSRLFAQELVPAPDPVGGHPTANAASEASPATSADAWRYHWFNDRWWYWTPENRWMWYSDDGQWVPYDTHQGASPKAQDQMPPPPNGGYSYPAPGYIYSPVPYYHGYYPGVGVRVAPYGTVGVGVGRRVGVNVWGPHGAVRVGRIHVGW